MKPNTLITTSKELPSFNIIVVAATLILFGFGNCFSQSQKTEHTINAENEQVERIAALEKRIAEAGDDFVSLTAEKYDLLLSQPIGTVDGFFN